MKRKKFLSIAMALSMSFAAVLSGCGNSSSKPAKEAESTTSADKPAESTGTDAAPAAVSHDTELTLEIYDVAANYQGLQTGWYGKILKDKFNLVLNIIAPQVAGDASSLYQTRSAAGNLGDIVILDNIPMQECIEAGLIADMGAEIKNYPNLMRYQEQIELFNGALSGVSEGSIYAIPTEMNTNGPTAYLEDTVYTCPRLPWDYYQELGAPEMNNLDDLLKVLSDMQAAHPTNANGEKAYAISLWPDWDGTSIETVNQLTKWYGQEVNGSILLGTDNSIVPLTDKDGAYYKMLHFLYDAQKMGLVDPDSATQDWTNVCDNKMKQKRVYLFWYNWQRGFWNTPEKGEKGDIYIATPLKDMNVYQASDTYYGSGRVWGIGSKVDPEKKARIMEFFDWLASPEGGTLQHAGTEGLIYTKNDDGTYKLTEDGFNRFLGTLTVPEDQGGGKWTDGNNQVNQWIIGSVETNPETGEPYATDLWKSTVEANKTKAVQEWQERFGAENEVKYLEGTGQLKPVASINKALTNDTTDIALIRNQCGDLLCDNSWKMIFASSDEEFEKLWDDMYTQLQGFGWDDLVAFDTEKWQVVADARKAAN